MSSSRENSSAVKPSAKAIKLIEEAITTIMPFSANELAAATVNIITDQLASIRHSLLLLPSLDTQDSAEIQKVTAANETIASNLGLVLERGLVDKALSSIKVNDKLFSDALYLASIALSNGLPRNTIDPCTQDEIAPEDAVFTSNRYQFDIRALVRWLHTKKNFINPHDNRAFSERDINTIKAFARSRNLDAAVPEEKAELPTAARIDLPMTITVQGDNSDELISSLLTGVFNFFSHRSEPHVPRNQIRPLSSSEQDSLLEEYYEYGMAQHHLNNIRVTSQILDSYLDTLSYLLRNLNVPVDTAIEEMADLHSESYLALLERLYAYGMRGHHLRNRPGLSDTQCDYLVYLVRHRKLAVDVAIHDAFTKPAQTEEMDRYCDSQLVRFPGLSDSKMTALDLLYIYGLRPEHLAVASCPDDFNGDHLNLLIYLIRDQQVAVVDALRVMNAADPDLLENLFVLMRFYGLKGEHFHHIETAGGIRVEQFPALIPIVHMRHSPIEVAIADLNGLNQAQTSAYCGLYSEGLRGDDLRNLRTRGLFESDHARLLVTLVQVGVSLADALREASELSSDEAKALSILYAYGLKGSDLRQFRRSDKYEEEHFYTLIYFIRDKQMTPTAALQKIAGLNAKQINTLYVLHAQGLEDHQLRQLTTADVFAKPHHDALLYQVREQKISVSAALQALDGLSAGEAEALIPSSRIKPFDSEGLSQEQVSTLERLHIDGLRREHLLAMTTPEGFDEGHKRALISLVHNQRMAVDAALHEIEGMSGMGAIVLSILYCRGFRKKDFPNQQMSERDHTPLYHALIYLIRDRKLPVDEAITEISQLSPEKLTILISLYSSGLRGVHLRNLQSPNEFTEDTHGAALKFFIKYKNRSIDEAIREIDGLSNLQIDSLIHFYPDGLRGEHFRNELLYCDFTKKHFFQLYHLLRIQQKTLPEALQQINGPVERVTSGLSR